MQEISNSAVVKKIGNGIYGLELSFQGREYFILNPFHPFQMDHFSLMSNRFMTIVCQSDLDYTQITNEICGFFDPEKAALNSIRKNLWELSKVIDIEISTLKNGVHVSPSSLEASFAICRCIPTRRYEETGVGAMLSALGGDVFKLYEVLRKNPFIRFRGENNFLFELCESKNKADIVEIVREVFFSEITDC